VKPVLGADRALESADHAVRAALAAGADEAEAVIMTADSQLTRYAAGRVHQNVAERDVEIRVRAVVGRRQAVSVDNQTDVARLAETASRATAMARLSPEDKTFPGLPGPHTEHPEQTAFYDSTAGLEADARAGAVRIITAQAAEIGADAYGAVTTGVTELAVANSRGTTAYQAATDSWLSVIAQLREQGPAGGGRKARTGYASDAHRDWGRLDPAAAGARAIARLRQPDRRTEVAPGRYTVLLQPEAVSELLMFLAAEALNGLAYLEGRSLFSGHLSQNRYPELVTLNDDPLDDEAANASFDFEGVPKQRRTLLDKGTVAGVVWDSRTAARAGTATTGNALPSPNPGGPVPLNLTIPPGPASTEELLRGMSRGLLVTRLHYVNSLDPARTLLTGTTRDGTFLVEGGEVVAAAQDLRWVESVDQVLARIVAVGSDRRLVSWGPGYGMRYFTANLLPPLLVEAFEVTGSAQV
jgi:PmbA protein